MSSRNTLENKYVRKATRGLSKLPAGSSPVGRVPQEVSANILSNPRQMRLSGRSRRRLQRGRGGIVVTVTKPSIKPAVRTALRLERLTLEKLHRRLAQAARRASTCKHIIESLSPNSMFAVGIKAEQSHQLSLCKQISAELKSRQKS